MRAPLKHVNPIAVIHAPQSQSRSSWKEFREAVKACGCTG